MQQKFAVGMEVNMKIQIGQNIRSLCRKRQVSQEDLAETMGVTVQAISKWETGKANPDLISQGIIPRSSAA